MGVEGSITDVTKQIAILMVGLATVLAPFALLTLPSCSNDGRDPNLSSRVVIMLATHRAEQQILEFFHGQLGDLAVFPTLAIVIQIHQRGIRQIGNFGEVFGANEQIGALLHERARRCSTRKVVEFPTGFALDAGSKVFAVGTFLPHGRRYGLFDSDEDLLEIGGLAFFRLSLGHIRRP